MMSVEITAVNLMLEEVKSGRHFAPQDFSVAWLHGVNDNAREVRHIGCGIIDSETTVNSELVAARWITDCVRL